VRRQAVLHLRERRPKLAEVRVAEAGKAAAEAVEAARRCTPLQRMRRT
jgi:hypothetical protein